ncbi:MAG: hypothetical protein ABI832_01000 [bacterium]
MFKISMMCSAVVLAGLPALAGPVSTVISPNVIMLMRDSDGVVISVIHPVEYWYRGNAGGPGGVIYTLDGHVLEFSGGPFNTAGGGPIAMMDGAAGGAMNPAAAPTVVVGNVRYNVEADGMDLWLVDPATGRRLATERRVSQAGPDAAGHSVNPTAFTLE